MTAQIPSGVEINASVLGAHTEILSAEALQFIASLHRNFESRRTSLLAQRKIRQEEIERGRLPDFLTETAAVRESQWSVAPVPADLQNRRVEITGPVDRKMVINALNSGANCFMADFEDAHSPTWSGTLDGQINVRDAVRGTIEYQSPEGKSYRLNPQTATLLIRPRGWHLNEKHLRVDGEMVSASLFDFGLYFFHNARERLKMGSGVYYYLPKLQHHLEARLWNDVFIFAQDTLQIPKGSIKATVLIEHILAAFQMEEILYELREHSAGLNCGRWDYLFSYIKTFASREEFIVPDRNQVTMTAPFLRSYALACIRACHKHGAFAMGGMSAFIPVKTDPEANAKAMEKVREDKRREATDGHDGTWVAHPGLVGIARDEFDKVLGTKLNQIARPIQDEKVTGAPFLQVPAGQITEEGLRSNIRVALQYLEAWIGGSGCVPLYNLMEDAATAEISRVQVWQWIHNPRGVLADGRRVTVEMVRDFLTQELKAIRAERSGKSFDEGRFEQARLLFDELVTADKQEEFLTLKAYDLLD
jgi:malate synthase